ncbi:MAG: glycosyltransferase [Bacteroidales bacterium]|nr:glycosyltransferase [Bacteroidales bacterium]MCM1146587.1 glycosyltransferase [Bacteroidales bacterium]MCM1205979.1 glycosyltransferase [Bacillota bacterium]MCM1510140.1 glycosyltransferase [Clostridium sp.]
MTISIITAAFNSERTIAHTIESVLAQTYKDIDYWIIDGASTDRTVEIARSYEERFCGKLHIVSQPDKGIYDAMNKGIGFCHGEIVGILNSDDFYTSADALETIARTFAADDDTDAVYGDIHFINENNTGKCVRYYSSGIFRPWMLRFGFMPAHPSFYVRNKVYEKYGLFSLDYRIASDYDLLVRLLYKHRIKAKYIKKDFVTMRTGGISTKNMRNRWLITRENVIACRRNGLYTNIVLISMKYLYKIFEFRI